MEVDYYDLLGVPVDASLAQIQSSYLARLQRLYDSAQSSGPLERASALEQMDLLRRAFVTLSDPDRRTLYDQSRSDVQKSPSPGSAPVCPQCGGLIRPTAHFCPRCGTSVRPVEGLPLNINHALPVVAAQIVLPPVEVESSQDAPLVMAAEPGPAAPPQTPASIAESGESAPGIQQPIQDASPPPIPYIAGAQPVGSESKNHIFGLSGQIDYSPVMDANTRSTLAVGIRLLPLQAAQINSDAEDQLAKVLYNQTRPLIRVIPYTPYLQIYPPYQDILITPGKDGMARFSHSLQQSPAQGNEIILHIAFHTQGDKLGETIVPLQISQTHSGGTSRGSNRLGSGIMIAAGIVILILLLAGLYGMITGYPIVSFGWLAFLLIISAGFLGLGFYFRSRAVKRVRVRF